MACSGRSLGSRTDSACSDATTWWPHLSGCHSGNNSTFVLGRHKRNSVYDDNACPHCKISDECLNRRIIPARITAYYSDLNPIEHVGYAWPTNCSPSTPSHLSTGTSGGIA
ncbi:hypothetical protein AVEN_265705-1 [Araneus ventricosus]|uniref:Uncharacterized protein n=1 Tax=Araneus ventricosus TaxID=182803 RepID=A0A4Y2KI99_ARAVE|nr:hypothetical protein AVEN_265705-1 [Araneus ventricosus]